jgi:hypothetical protein
VTSHEVVEAHLARIAGVEATSTRSRLIEAGTAMPLPVDPIAPA